MNKKLKIATIAVSAVMAGTMAFGMFGCTKGGGENNGDSYTPVDATISATKSSAYNAAASAKATALVTKLQGDGFNLTTRVNENDKAWQIAKGYWDNTLKDSIASNPSADAPNLSYADKTKIGIAIGHNKADVGAFYSDVSGNPVLPDGTLAQAKALKPAFKAIQDTLNVEFTDGYKGDSTSSNLATLKTSKAWGTSVDICTSDLSKAVTSANGDNDILNLGDYLDKMPNFKAFLESNPIVYLSLLQNGMQTDGTGKKIYVAPYFDGNDDIERYCLIRQDWVVDLLDKDLADEGDHYGNACGTVAVGSWMGQTGKYEVATTNENGEGTFTLTKDYDAALAAAKSETTELGKAYKAITGAVYSGASGNIVDIMNAAIEGNLQVRGKALAELYRAYIDVAYKNGTNKAYTKRSDVFNGYNAAWDVDDLVAMLRIVKTNSPNLGLKSLQSVGIFPRDTSNDRTPDIIRLVGELYGERGADSRYEATYIDKDGKLKDMRNNASFYQALENFGAMAKEGLVVKYIGETEPAALSTADLKGDCKNKPGIGFMMCDYSQTQTTQMFNVKDDDDYLFAAVNTPVSRWDTDADASNGKETVMRFTESWRSTKTSGLTVAASVKDNEDKLNAVLTFIDYLYSNDGQILSTFGPQSTNGNTNPNGFWYGTEVTNVDIATVAHKVGGQYVVNEDQQSKYFCFKDKLYAGTLYKGKMTPTVTDATYSAFVTSDSDAAKLAGGTGNFTNFGRRVLGATLPMGVKDQSFENQLTAKRAADAATKVSVSIANGTIKHPELTLQDNLWYTVVPTSLPADKTISDNLNATSQDALLKLTGKYTAKAKYYSLYHYIIFYGYEGSYKVEGQNFSF